MILMLLKRRTILRFVGPKGPHKADAAETELGLRCQRISINEVRLTEDIAIPSPTSAPASAFQDITAFRFPA